MPVRPCHRCIAADTRARRGFLATCTLLVACLLAPLSGGLQAQPGDDPAEQRIIVAIEERADPAPTPGSTSRGYGGLPNYSGSERTQADSARLARRYDLTEVAAWTIGPLRVRCMLYEIAPGSRRDEVLARLQKDRMVRLAQPLQDFSTLSSPVAMETIAEPDPRHAQFDDPYVGLQTGFVSIGAAQAQRLTNGEDVRVALVDTGVDAAHPDLQGRIREQRDFVGGSDAGLDRHGTEVAGVLAAVANNGIGIVGVAPGVRLLSYRACWPLVQGASAARCNSFTLAQALSAAIEAGAQVINLSLGGPHDPLLEQLLEVAFGRGIIVVGATPANGVPDGFPSAVPGVIAVSASPSASAPMPAIALAAPGTQILTLEPGGSYDYASGSSLATAHVTGTIAMLIQLAPDLDSAALTALLRQTSRSTPGLINACAAVHVARGDGGRCDEAAVATRSGLPPTSSH